MEIVRDAPPKWFQTLQSFIASPDYYPPPSLCVSSFSLLSQMDPLGHKKSSRPVGIYRINEPTNPPPYYIGKVIEWTKEGVKVWAYEHRHNLHISGANEIWKVSDKIDVISTYNFRKLRNLVQLDNCTFRTVSTWRILIAALNNLHGNGGPNHPRNSMGRPLLPDIHIEGSIVYDPTAMSDQVYKWIIGWIPDAALRKILCDTRQQLSSHLRVPSAIDAYTDGSLKHTGIR